MLYEIERKDAPPIEMTLCAAGSTVEGEIAQWDDAMKSTLSTGPDGGYIIHQVQAFKPRPEMVDTVPTIPTGIDGQTRELMLQMAEALAASSRANTALDDRVRQLEGTIAALKGAV